VGDALAAEARLRFVLVDADDAAGSVVRVAPALNTPIRAG
jgi:hypothetical protein